MADVEEAPRVDDSRRVKWTPDPSLVQPMLEMGIGEDAAKRSQNEKRPSDSDKFYRGLYCGRQRVFVTIMTKKGLNDMKYLDNILNIRGKVWQFQLKDKSGVGMIDAKIQDDTAMNDGLYYTGSVSVDAAASWVFDNMDDPNLHTPFEVEMDVLPMGQDNTTPLKMVFAVNSELKMGVGKIAAQVAHAGLAIQKKIFHGEERIKRMHTEWEEMGSTKIVLKGGSAADLMEMENQAKAAELPCYLVIDAGRTQIQAASVTVVGIFGRAEDVDQITGTLSLL